MIPTHLHIGVLRRGVYGEVAAGGRRLRVGHAAAHRRVVRLAQTDQHLRLYSHTIIIVIINFILVQHNKDKYRVEVSTLLLRAQHIG